jgi:hypothetical protein
MVTAMLNDRARTKYNGLITALEILGSQLPAVEKEIRKMNPRVKGRTYRMATPDELLKMVTDIRRSIVDFTEVCKKYETKLTTNDWKV